MFYVAGYCGIVEVKWDRGGSANKTEPQSVSTVVGGGGGGAATLISLCPALLLASRELSIILYVILSLLLRFFCHWLEVGTGREIHQHKVTVS